MAIKERLMRLEKKSDNLKFSLIPQQERVVVVSGYIPEEREIKMKARIAELHEKYGDFDESCLIRVPIRKFCKPNV